MSKTHILLHIFFLTSDIRARKSTRRSYFLLAFPLIHTDMIDRDRRRCPCIFHVVLFRVVSVVFRSLHLRERRKSGRDRLLLSCRQAPIGIPKRRVESAQVAHNPAIAIATAIWRTSTRPYESYTFVLKEGNNLWEPRMVDSSFSWYTENKKKNDF